jgi:hypothetical protein
MSNNYEKDGIEYPRVTGILDMLDKSNALIPWALNLMESSINTKIDIKLQEQPNFCNTEQFRAIVADAKKNYKEVSQEAKDIGSMTHDLIEHYIKSGKDKSDVILYPNEVQNAFIAFLEWETFSNVEWLESEKSIFNTEKGYAGTLDAICLIGGVKYVIDFKTSKGFYDTYPLQIAAYANFDGSDIKNCGVLRIDKLTGLPEWKDYSKDIDRNYRAFCALLDFYYLFKNRRLKGNARVKNDITA